MLPQPSHAADLRLSQCIPSGDTAAVAELYTPHRRLVFSIVLRILRSPFHQAEGDADHSGIDRTERAEVLLAGAITDHLPNYAS